MRLDEYGQMDAVALAELVRAGEVSPAELAETAHAAAEVINPAVNALAGITDPISDAAADGPLRGVPVLVKDLFHGVVGVPCGNGSRLAPGYAPTAPTLLTQRTLRAGMSIVGRSTTSEFGIMGTTETLAHGATVSPWSPAHMAGGSSGGAAAAVGSGIVPIALASDGGGSIRIPAASCGVVGLKPSRGRVPWGLRGHEPLAGWAVQFAVTRTVRDSAVALDALCGPYPLDSEGLARPDVPFAQAMRTPPAPLRVAYWTTPWSGQEANPVLTAATAATAGLLEGLGHHVVEATPAIDWERYLEAMTTVWAATNAGTVDGVAAATGSEVTLDNVEGATLEMVELGRSLSAGQLLRALDTQAYFTLVCAEFFQQYDVLLTPTLADVVAPIGLYDQHALTPAQTTFDTWSRWECFLPLFNTTGQPAISLPLHQTEDGLPIGMQFVAGSGREDVLLALAAVLEQEAPWSGRRPPAYVY